MGGVSFATGVTAIDPMPNQRLFVLRAANFQLTSDQVFTKLGNFTNYVISHVIAKQVSGGATVACVGGIYTGASKAGDALVAAAQSWIGLSGANTIVNAALAALVGTNLESAIPNLSLTTGSTAAVTADVFIYGFSVD